MKKNPFVGPRSFDRQDAGLFFGREREASIIVDLMIAERVVLLYSPSGAGKTSLLQAAVIPLLEQNFFQVLPLIRVNTSLTGGSAGNRYIVSTILSLEEGVPKKHRLGLDQIIQLSLQDYLALYKKRAQTSGSETIEMDEERSDQVLIFDQFEEILTVDPAGIEEKALFFRELGTALADTHRWALFAMREEFEAGLDPYKNLLPTRLRTRYRLELLGEAAAKQAIQLPSQASGVAFTDEAARRIVDDLRRISVQLPDGSREQRLGTVVEPVQLQVVCRQLWADIPEGQSLIDAERITSLKDVDTALAGYYAEQVRGVADTTMIPERLIRRWFEKKLITDFSTRGQVLKEPASSAGLQNHAIDLLIDSHIVRAEHRLDATWFELAHDRLIEPLKKDNAIWHDANLSLLQRQAEFWDQQQRPEGLLLQGQSLLDAEAWASTHPGDVSATEKQFLSQCLTAQARGRREKRQKRLILVLTLIVGIAALGAYRLWVNSRPWGRLTNLSSGRVYNLSNNYVIIGRNSPRGVKVDVSLLPTTVSRMHMLIDKSYNAFDMRSLSGTSVNGTWLRYGELATLKPGDILTLAGTAAFRFQPVSYTPWQLLSAPQTPAGVPENAWGLFIEDNRRVAYPLKAERYYLSLSKDQVLQLSSAKPTNEQTLAIIQQDKKSKLMWPYLASDGKEEMLHLVSIIAMAKGWPLEAEMKIGSTYGYARCPLPFGEHVSIIRLSPSCIYEGRQDFQETDLGEQSIMNVKFILGTKKSFRFHILPVLRNLEPPNQKSH